MGTGGLADEQVRGRWTGGLRNFVGLGVFILGDS